MFFVSISAFGQDHIKILGHYIDEPNFKNTLIKEGKISLEDGFYVGNFGGYKSYFLFIPNDDDKICAIKISKPKYEKWADLKRTYYSYKDLFSEKYYLTNSIEETGMRAGSSLSENDYALHYLANGDGKFISFFDIPNGQIMLSISPKEGKEFPDLGEVVIYYIDNINYGSQTAKDNKKKLDDI